MTGIIVTVPPTVELPPGSTSGGGAVLPGVTYTYAIISLPQTWSAKQTFPLGNISVQSGDVAGLSASATTDTTNASNIISGTLPAAQLPNPTASTLGGIKSLANAANKWINSIGTDGTPTQTQPAFSNLSGSIAVAQVNSGISSSATTFFAGDNSWKVPFALTTTGSSGAATFSAGTLNIPNYVGGVTSIAGNTGAFTLSNGITNSTNDIRLNVNGLAAYTSPFRQTDYLLIYDVANSTHKKILPKDLNYAFSAHKNGTNQTGVANSTDTKITFGTSIFNVGGYYNTGTSVFTPPQGRVLIAAQFYGTGTIPAGNPYVLAVWKNGAVLKEGFIYSGGTNNGNCGVSLVDDANGTDFYEIYVRFTGVTGTAAVDGTAKWTWFTATVL